MHKKAQGMSIRTILIVVIGLIVVVVLTAVLNGRIGNFESGLHLFGDASKTCSSQGEDGGVSPELKYECGDGETSISSSDGPGQGKECCKTVGSTSAQSPSSPTTSTSECGGIEGSVCKLDCGQAGLTIPNGDSDCANILKPKCCIV